MAALIGLAALAIYAWITPAVSGMGDGPEFTIALATAGLTHPTGYPLYTLAGHLFVKLLHALGSSWPLAANLWSGAGAAFAVSLCYRLSRDVAPEDSKTAALLPPVLLALNPLLLDECSKAEVNTWSLAWTMGIALLFHRVIRRDGVPGTRDAVAWGLLCGVGLAHHLMSALVSLPLSAALLLKGFRPKLFPAAAGAAALPLLGYAFVAWRAFHPAPGQWPDIAPTVAGFLRHVTGERYRVYIGFFAPDEENRTFLSVAVFPYLLPGLLCLVAAARSGSGGRRAEWWGLFAAAMLVLLFTLSYGVPDPAPYLLPTLALALVGIVPVASWLPAAPRRAAAVILVVLALALGSNQALDARERRASVTRFDRDVRELWSLIPPESSIVLWPSDQVARLTEYQVLRGEKPRVWVSTPEFLLDPPVLAEIRTRFGVDLMNGVTVPYAPMSEPWGAAVRRRFFEGIVARLNERTHLAVYWFDPSIPRLALLPKGRGDGTGAGERAGPS